MNTIQFRKGSKQKYVFLNAGGEAVGSALPTGPWVFETNQPNEVVMTSGDILEFGPKQWGFGVRDFWRCWSSLIKDVEVDHLETIEIVFQESGYEDRHKFPGVPSLNKKEIIIQGECRAVCLDFGFIDAGTWGELEQMIVDFPHIQVLFVRNVREKNLNLSILAGLPELWCLGILRSPTPTGLGIEYSDGWDDFVGLPSLRVLQLSGFQSPKDCSYLSELESLEWLEISDANSLRGLKGLAPLKRLEHLVINDADELISFRKAGRMTALKSLKVNKAPCLQSLEGIKSFSALEKLELHWVHGLQDAGELAQLSRLNRANISSNSLRDVSNLAGHPSLQRLTVRGPGVNAEVESNRDALATISQLRELRGFEESVRVDVLFRAACLREDHRMMRRLLPDVLDLHRDGKPEGTAVRQAVIQSLMSLKLTDEEWKIIHDFPWSAAEWADLFVATDSCGTLLESQLAEFERSEKGTLFNDVPHLFRYAQTKDEGSHIRVEGWIEVKDAFKGYIHAVARDNGWNGSKQMIQFAANLFLENDASHESWEEIQIDLLLATLELGLEEQHGQLLTHITDTQRSEFKEQLVWRRANIALFL